MKSTALVLIFILTASLNVFAHSQSKFKNFVVGERVFHKQRQACGYVAELSDTGTLTFYSASRGIYLAEVLGIELAREATNGCYSGLCNGDLVYGIERVRQKVNGHIVVQSEWRTGSIATIFDNGWARVQIDGQSKLVCASLNHFVKRQIEN